MSTPEPYLALALQTACHSVNDAATPAASRARIAANIARIARQVVAAKSFVGPDVRLVVLPEFVLTGFPLGEDAASWSAKAALEIGGAEYQALGAIAREADVYLAGNAYERDPHFPQLYFQTCFLMNPAGEVRLRYRRLISMFTPSPYDVWDRYVATYGLDAVFPIADTELGRLAAIASEEILYPELARALALRGAEILLHSSSEVASAVVTAKNIAKQARAAENLAYVVSANTAGIAGTDIPERSTDGSSKIVDYHGRVLAEADCGESMAACAEIDVASLRRYRRRPGLGNLLSRQPLALWRHALAIGNDMHPANGLLDEHGAPQSPGRSFFRERQQRMIDKLAATGII